MPKLDSSSKSFKAFFHLYVNTLFQIEYEPRNSFTFPVLFFQEPANHAFVIHKK